MHKLFTPAYWKKGWRYMREFGWKETVRHFHQGKPESSRYEEHFLRYRVTEEELLRQRNHAFAHPVRISIVIPLYNTREDFLRELLHSIADQSYTNWELCLADGSTEGTPKEVVLSFAKEDGIPLVQMSSPAQFSGEDANRDEDAKADAGTGLIRYCRLDENLGISGNTNAAIAMATGDYLLFADHDDFLEKDALYCFAERIDREPALDILYSDEDLTDEKGKTFFSPRYKPEFNPDFLTSINYICHIFVVRRRLAEEAGGLYPAFDGAQDWDFILRCTEKTDRIGHIPRILYHWRAYEASTAGNKNSKDYALDAGRRAVQAHFDRIGQKAVIHETGIFVLFRPSIAVTGEPKVSILIPNKDHIDLLKTCLISIESKSTWKNYEIIIIENNSTDPETFAFYDQIVKEYDHIKIVTYSGPFNYPAINNYGARAATGDYLILLNNDTQVRSEAWIEEMLGYCQRENTGIVGARLLYPDDTIQHAGVLIGIRGFAGHVEAGAKRTDSGYFGRIQAVQDISAVTGACLMIRKTVFDEVGGLDESFAVSLNDVDLCLRVREKGYLIVMNPGAELYHYESKSRGSDEKKDRQNHERFKKEIGHFRKRWKRLLEEGDPYYNPNLSLRYGDSRVREAEEERFELIDEIEREEKKREDRPNGPT